MSFGPTVQVARLKHEYIKLPCQLFHNTKIDSPKIVPSQKHYCYQLIQSITMVRFQIHRYRIFILVVTFLSYVCYHMSRKPISVVKPELLKCPNETVTALKLQLSSSSKDSILEDDLNCHSFIGKNDAQSSANCNKKQRH